MQKRRLPLAARPEMTVGGKATALDTTSPFGKYRATFLERIRWSASDWRVMPATLRQQLRKRFARPVTGPFDVTFEGMKLRLYPAENHCDRIIFGRSDLPERAEHEALLPYLKPGMVFVDIGANVGSYSCFVGTRCGGDATLIALEPHPRTVEKLRFNLAANDLSVENVVQAAAGPAVTRMELWSDGGSNIGHTSLLPEGTANAKVSETVAVRPLLDILGEAGVSKIDLLKIDVEGFEDRALASFFDAAPDHLLPQHILIEVAHRLLWERDLLQIFAGKNYEVGFRTAENLLFSRK